MHRYPKVGLTCLSDRTYENAGYRTIIAKADILMLGFWRDWGPRSGMTETSVCADLKARNPDILLGQYVIYNELPDNDTPTSDLWGWVNTNNMWLRNAAGQRTQWTNQYNAWDINITPFKAPVAGKRYAQYRAQRDYTAHFQNNPHLDFWVCDNGFAVPRTAQADYKGIGTNQNATDADVIAAWRVGYREWYQAIREVDPNRMIFSNMDGDGSAYSGVHDIGNIEKIVGSGVQSYGDAYGWEAGLQRYRDAFKHISNPASKLVTITVDAPKTNLQVIRYGLCTALMDDGYFVYTEQNPTVSAPFWPDEFSLELGEPTAVAQHNEHGVWYRTFENGMAIVNPHGTFERLGIPNRFYKRFQGTQAPSVNTGEVLGNSVTVPGKDGLILMRVGV